MMMHSAHTYTHKKCVDTRIFLWQTWMRGKKKRKTKNYYTNIFSTGAGIEVEMKARIIGTEISDQKPFILISYVFWLGWPWSFVLRLLNGSQQVVFDVWKSLGPYWYERVLILVLLWTKGSFCHFCLKLQDLLLYIM